MSDAEGTAKWTDGDAFVGLQTTFYWSSSPVVLDPNFDAWRVSLYNGYTVEQAETNNLFVWPVRGGQ